MKKFLIILLLFTILNSKSQAQTNKIDSIYIICYQENLSGKIHLIKDNKSKIDFFFNVKWKLHDGNHESIILNYIFPDTKSNFWSVPLKKLSDISANHKTFTLEEFTKKLNDDDFIQTLPKKQLMMLYGEKCSTKFEVYPVKIGTDLSSEG